MTGNFEGSVSAYGLNTYFLTIPSQGPWASLLKYSNLFPGCSSVTDVTFYFCIISKSILGAEVLLKYYQIKIKVDNITVFLRRNMHFAVPFLPTCFRSLRTLGVPNSWNMLIFSFLLKLGACPSVDPLRLVLAGSLLAPRNGQRKLQWNI
jgi:hypothetical protein